jgi:hypothetical protein
VSIPQHTMDGVLPPFIGASPAEASDLMSPYLATPVEVVERFADTMERVEILRGWLSHRRELRTIGFAHGLQWIDGSFVESKPPRDIDVTSYVYMGFPSFVDTNAAWVARGANQRLFDRGMVKAVFKVDAFFLDLLDPPEVLLDASRYFFGLFSHQRITMIWKGMLQVRLEDDGSDAAASQLLDEISNNLPQAAPGFVTPSLFGTQGTDDAS